LLNLTGRSQQGGQGGCSVGRWLGCLGGCRSRQSPTNSHGQAQRQPGVLLRGVRQVSLGLRVEKARSVGLHGEILVHVKGAHKGSAIHGPWLAKAGPASCWSSVRC
jgi:hypothetical protein